jgi:hypothetical protein
MTTDPRVESTRQLLRVTFGIVPFLAGLDKFFGLLADWPGHLSPAVRAVLPVSPTTFMHLAGVVEMAVGVVILTRWTRIGGYVAAAWLAAIALNLVASGRFLDVAVRDVVMAIAAFGLARLTEAGEAAGARATPQVDTAHRPGVPIAVAGLGLVLLLATTTLARAHEKEVSVPACASGGTELLAVDAVK